jgi:uncharacterized protein
MTTTLRAALVALLGVAAFAPAALASKEPPPPSKGEMKVHDDAGLFSPESVVKAEAKFDGITFKSPTHLTVRTVKNVPSDRKRDFEKAKDSTEKRHEFMAAWAKELAQAEGDRGVVVLVCDEARSIEVISDRQTDVNRQFSDADAKRVHEILSDGFKEANAAKTDDEKRTVRGESLVRATDFVIAQLRNTSAPEATGSTHSDGGHETKKSAGMPWWGWVLIVAGILLVVWVIVALIRAMSGNVYGGGYGGYGGYGGGGGGFFPSFLGGMFGAAAGMWMYNSMFGGHMYHDPGYAGGGADGYTGDTGPTDTGAGDFDNGAEAGGDWGDSGGADAGGGDWGGDGGGGDWGGDGGGGDWGGGGDFGGGGDW